MDKTTLKGLQKEFSRPTYTGLSCLPTELMLEIFRYLDLHASGNLRLSCKRINAQVQAEADLQFSQRDHRVIVEHRTLLTLVNIAEHPRMSLLIHKMTFTNHIYSEATPRRTERKSDGTDFLGEPFEGYLARNVLKVSGEARRLLVMALRNFKNLKTIRISNELIDQELTRDSPYGIARFLIESSEADEFKELLVSLVLTSLTEAGVRPDKMYIEAKSDCCETVSGGHYRIPLYSFTVPAQLRISDMLGGLTLLSLRLKFLLDEDDRFRLNSVLTFKNEAPLRAFVSHLTSLRTLRLDFKRYELKGTSFLIWLGDIQNGPSLDKLKVLDLSFPSASIQVFEAVCLRFKISEIILYYPLIMLKGDASSKCNYWAMFLQSVSHKFATEKRHFKRFKIAYACQWREPESYHPAGQYRTDRCLSFKGVSFQQYRVEYIAGRDDKTIHEWLNEAAESLDEPSFGGRRY